MAIEDGYDYGQHLREIRPDGLFIPRGSTTAERGPGSVVSHAHSASSHVSRVSRVSRLSRASIQLRSVAEMEDAFESAEELAFGVGGALNDMNEAAHDDDEAREGGDGR